MVKKSTGKEHMTTRIARPSGAAKGYAEWLLANWKRHQTCHLRLWNAEIHN